MGHRRNRVQGENISEPICVDTFRKMCASAISAGHFSHARSYYHKHRERPLTLSDFCIGIKQQDEKTYYFRLDHALCLLKMENDLDYLGEQIKGAVLYYLSGESFWTLFYTTRPDGNVSLKGRGSIDHVVPKAAGGADALINMQMTRAGSNFRKADTQGFSFCDGTATRKALAFLDAGTKACEDETMRQELAELLGREYLAVLSQG